LGPSTKFLEELEAFLEKRGQPLKTVPVVDGNEVDLYKLYCAVKKRGGVQKVFTLYIY
jgi:hypothetical protein